nr:flagellar hook-length control protein FliK [Sphingomonas corticis]
MVAESRATRDDLSIRLVPDALGTVDVSLKRDGDTVQVQITAEHAQTRQLLAEAAPKLAELAEKSGVRLHQPGSDAAGTGTSNQRPQQQAPQQQQPAAPPSARRRAADTATPSDADRVA